MIDRSARRVSANRAHVDLRCRRCRGATLSRTVVPGVQRADDRRRRSAGGRGRACRSAATITSVGWSLPAAGASARRPARPERPVGLPRRPGTRRAQRDGGCDLLRARHLALVRLATRCLLVRAPAASERRLGNELPRPRGFPGQSRSSSDRLPDEDVDEVDPAAVLGSLPTWTRHERRDRRARWSGRKMYVFEGNEPERARTR